MNKTQYITKQNVIKVNFGCRTDMNLYPTLKIEYYSSLPIEVVLERINERIEPESFTSFFTTKKKYTGIVSDREFLISQSQVPTTLNPYIRGIVESRENGCKITVFSSPNILVKVFMGIWLGFAALACIIITIDAITTRRFTWGVLIPYAFFAIGYGFMWGSVVFGTEQDDVLILDLLGNDAQLISKADLSKDQ